MPDFRAVLGQSIASTVNSELLEARETYIKNISNPIRRLGALGLHNLAVHYPETAVKLINSGNARRSGVEFIWAGGEADVYRADQNVIKVLRSSDTLDAAGRTAMASERKAEFEQISNFLGKFMLEQTIEVGDHPVTNSRQVVKTIQPFIELIDLKLFNGSDINQERLEEVCDKYPGTNQKLSEFVESSLEMVSSAGLMPDTIGRANLVINQANNELTLLDSHPLPITYEYTRPIIAGHLSSLRQKLALIT